MKYLTDMNLKLKMMIIMTKNKNIDTKDDIKIVN
jgi:hypothetical protein